MVVMGGFRTTASCSSDTLFQLSKTTMGRPRDSNPDQLDHRASAHPVGPGRLYSWRGSRCVVWEGSFIDSHET